MGKYLKTSIGDEFVAAHRRRKNWKRIVSVLGCLVAAGTLTALTLPAITMSQPDCGLEEHQHGEACHEQILVLACNAEIHQHTEECRDDADNLICGYADFVIHEHDGACYDAEGSLICSLPEIKEHQHDESCYQPGEETIVDAGHQHSDVCYSWTTSETPTCGLEASEAHQHTPECFGQVRCEESVCGEEEREPVIEPGEPKLICQEPEVLLHTHGDTCFSYDEDGNKTGLICQQIEVLEHRHGDDCFTTQAGTSLTCSLPEHIHTDDCWAPESPTKEAPTQVDALILLIDGLPSPEEVNTQLGAFEESGDTAGRETYLAALTEQTAPALAQYEALTGEEKAAVTNADKLLALEGLLPEVPPEPTETLPPPTEEGTVVDITVAWAEEPLDAQLHIREYDRDSEEWLAYHTQITEAGWTLMPEQTPSPEEAEEPPAQTEATETTEATDPLNSEAAVDSLPDETIPEDLRLFQIEASAGEEGLTLSDPVPVTLSYPLDAETPCRVLAADGSELVSQTVFAEGIQTTICSVPIPGTLGLLLGPDWQWTEPAPEPPMTLTSLGEDYSVTVTYGPEAGLPAGTELTVTDYGDDSEIPLQRYMQASVLYGWAEGEFHPFRLFSISLAAGGEAVQPQAPVEVAIALSGLDGQTEYQVTHYGAETAEALDAVSDFAEGTQTIRFTAAGFSDFSISAVEGTQVTPLANVSTDIAPVSGYTAAKGTYNTWQTLSDNFLNSCQKLQFVGDSTHREVPEGQKIQVGEHYTDTALSGDQTVYPFVIPVSNTILENGGTVEDCGSIIFTNTGTVGGRPVDTVVTFDQVRFSGNFKAEYLAHYKNAPVGAKNGKVCIAAVKHSNELWIGMNYCTDVAAKERYGDSYYTYPCVLNSDVTITIRDHETKQPVSTQFLQTASDIDVWRGGGTWTYPGHEKAVTEPYRGRYAETFTTISGFSNTFYCYPQSRNKITEKAAGQVSVAATINTITNDGKLTDTGTTYINGVSGQNSWKKAGVYGETLGSTWKMQYIDQWCSTEVEIYVPQWPLTVKKVDSVDSELALADAKFILSRQENNATVYYTASGWVNDPAQAHQLTTAADGTVTVTGLNPGRYTLTEVEAPPGYQLRGSSIVFDLSIGGTVTCSDPMVTVAEDNSLLLQVQNKAGSRLPETGGTGTSLYTFSGWAVMVAACALMYNSRRKQRKGAR